jgi:coenzyme Q-binding protein COQ10
VPKFETTRRVPYTPSQMFSVVAGVEHYPEFLPLCTGLTVHSRDAVDGVTTVIATMSVGYQAIRESFKTRVTLTPATPQILVEYLDGPFRRLENRWTFLPAGAGCDVRFYIDYEFRSPMLGLLMGALFDKAFRKFSEAFEDRARAIYGPPGSAAVAAAS